MTHGSLFSGIGGFDLAAEWMGWQNVFHCEWNEFGQKVLKYYWPEAESFTDITKTDFTKYEGAIDIISGGFPCQPYSTAGKRLGKEDERHLWPHMLRTIQEVKPRWVVGENVRGLISWNGGLVFEEVQADLEAAGYEVQPFLLPACGVNAPHRRDRIWFVAYSSNKGGSAGLGQIQGKNGEIPQWNNNAEFGNPSDGASSNAKDLDALRLGENNGNRESIDTGKWEGVRSELGNASGKGDASDTEGRRSGRLRNAQEKTRARKSNELFRSKHTIPNWQNFPTVSPLCTGNDGLSNRLDSITFPKWRNESIKAGGNAIVPQVVYQIFKAIEQYDTRTQKKD